MPYLLIGAVIIVALAIARSTSKEATPAIAGAPAPKKAKTLNDALLSAALELLPTSASILRPSDAAIDPVYGGRIADMYGAPAWKYYQTLLDANGKKGGTTCGIVLAYLMSKAGWPADMINRATDDQWAPGGGFTPGMPISKEVGGAQKHGWYMKAPAPDAWQPGDAYHIDHPPTANSDHVGTVIAVNGNQIETADGGQETGSTIKRNIRTLSADGKTITLNGVPARVLGLIRATPEQVA